MESYGTHIEHIVQYKSAEVCLSFINRFHSEGGYTHPWLTRYRADPALPFSQLGSVMLTKANRMKFSTTAKTQHGLLSVISTFST